MADIRAVTNYTGSFVAGTTAYLFISITNMEGFSVDPDVISLDILDDSSANVLSAVPEKVANGYFVYEWEIPGGQSIGPYTALWNYTTNAGTQTEQQGVIVIAEGDAPTISKYSGRYALYRKALEDMICCSQRIPVYHEQAKFNETNDVAFVTFPRWNQSAGTRVYRNNKLIETGLEVDYFKGKVYFSNPVSIYDVINIDYNFRWFSDDQLDQFLNMSVSSINSFPPASKYALLNLPSRFYSVLLYGAAKDALREMMLCLQFQQPQEVFGGAERADKAFANMETLKKNYEGDWKLLLEQKKYGPYPQIRMVSVPEFTLPGGRSRWFKYLFSSGSG